MSTPLRLEIHFTGHVQGVGFRWSTVQVSKEFEVAGWVRNLADGRVQLEVEGVASEVESFVAEVTRRMGDYIRRTERRELPLSGSYQDFKSAPEEHTYTGLAVYRTWVRTGP